MAATKAFPEPCDRVCLWVGMGHCEKHMRSQRWNNVRNFSVRNIRNSTDMEDHGVTGGTLDSG